MKEIHFHVDESGVDDYTATDFSFTDALIHCGVPCLHTTSMAHLSFDLLDIGYRIFVHKNSKCVEFKPGMDNPMGKDIRRTNNVLKLFMQDSSTRCSTNAAETPRHFFVCQVWRPLYICDKTNKSMRVLYLPLKKVWYDMIKSGIKNEEYRKRKPFYRSRFIDKDGSFKKYDKVVFTLGYPKGDDSERHLEFNNPHLREGEGKPEWGAEPGEIYYVITWES